MTKNVTGGREIDLEHSEEVSKRHSRYKEGKASEALQKLKGGETDRLSRKANAEGLNGV